MRCDDAERGWEDGGTEFEAHAATKFLELVQVVPLSTLFEFRPVALFENRPRWFWSAVSSVRMDGSVLISVLWRRSRHG